MATISRKQYGTGLDDGGSDNDTSSYYISAKTISNDLGLPLQTQVDLRAIAILTNFKTEAELTLGSEANVSMMDFDGKSFVLTATSISVSPTSTSFSNTGGTRDITVTANGSFLLSNVPDWMYFVPSFGRTSVTLTLYANNNSFLGNSSKTASVGFVGSGGATRATLSVSIDGNPGVFDVTPNSSPNYVNYLGTTINYTVTLSNEATPTATLSNTTGFGLGSITKTSTGTSTSIWNIPVTRTQNNGSDDKSTVLTINGSDGNSFNQNKPYTIIQNANYFVDIKSTPTTFGVNGDTITGQTISFDTLGNWTATISGTDAAQFFVSDSNGTGGTGKSIKVYAYSNSLFSARNARLTIAVSYNNGVSSTSDYVDLSQVASLATMAISKSGKNDFPYSGTTDSFALDITPDSGNNGWSVSLNNSVGSSFQISKTSSTSGFGTSTLTGNGDTTIWVKALAHSSYTQTPTGVVTVTASYGGASATYTGVQLKKPNNISINSGNNLQFITGNIGQTQTVNLTMNSDALLSWSITAPSWVTISPSSGTYTGSARSITFTANEINPSSTNSRQGTITAYAEGFYSQITITQPAYQTVQVAPTSYTWAHSDNIASKYNVTINSNAGFKITNVGTANENKFKWFDSSGNELTFSGTPLQYTNTGTAVLLKIAPIGTTTTRYIGTWRFDTLNGNTGPSFTAIQNAPPSLSLSPATLTQFAQSNATGQLVTITSNTSWTASITGAGFGISSTDSTYGTTNISGTGNGGVWVNATSNNTGESARTGTLTVSVSGLADQTRSVSQAALPTFGTADITATGFDVDLNGTITEPTVTTTGTNKTITYTTASNSGTTYTKAAGFPLVTSNTTRYCNITVTVPAGYHNAGRTVTKTVSATQELIPTFTSADITLTGFDVNSAGTITAPTTTRPTGGTLVYSTATDGGGTTVTAANGFALVNVNTTRYVTYTVTVPAGYYNTGGSVSKSASATQEPASTFASSDISISGFDVNSAGTITAPTISPSGTIVYSTATNGGGTTYTKAAGFPLVNVNTTRYCTVTVTVPAGYYNAGDSVSRSVSATQELATTFTSANISITGFDVDQYGTITAPTISPTADSVVYSQYSNGTGEKPVPPTKFSLVSVNTLRYVTVTVTVPNGYYNQGDTISRTVSATQEERYYDYDEISISGFDVNSAGTVTVPTTSATGNPTITVTYDGGAAVLTKGYPLSLSAVTRTATATVTVPSGWYNSGGSQSRSQTATQEAAELTGWLYYSYTSTTERPDFYLGAYGGVYSNPDFWGANDSSQKSMSFSIRTNIPVECKITEVGHPNFSLYDADDALLYEVTVTTQTDGITPYLTHFKLKVNAPSAGTSISTILQLRIAAVANKNLDVEIVLGRTANSGGGTVDTGVVVQPPTVKIIQV